MQSTQGGILSLSPGGHTAKFAEISSRIAACGQPPVSTAVTRSSGSTCAVAAVRGSRVEGPSIAVRPNHASACQRCISWSRRFRGRGGGGHLVSQ